MCEATEIWEIWNLFVKPGSITIIMVFILISLMTNDF